MIFINGSPLAKIFIDENYYESIGLEEISQQAFLFPFSFSSLIYKNLSKYSPSVSHTKRIEKAKQLLAENKAINDVCSEVGFESIGSFSTLFKKRSVLRRPFIATLPG